MVTFLLPLPSLSLSCRSDTRGVRLLVSRHVCTRVSRENVFLVLTKKLPSDKIGSYIEVTCFTFEYKSKIVNIKRE